ncbi:MAG: 2Fe-2S iron-sulfur cluster binding domain-containing protein, partial [Alphaproteobacteria bacterium]
MTELRFNGAVYGCEPPETVLDALTRQDAAVPFFCRNGICLTCMMRSRAGTVPERSQKGLKDTLRLEGHFLPCICQPDQDLEIELPDDAAIFGRAVVRAVTPLAPNICRLTLDSATPLYYRAGQFVNLRCADGLVRSYSLASVPRLDDCLDIHVKRLPRGRMSNWIFDDLAPGDSLDVQGPNGECFYVPGRPETPLLLIGNGSGLAPLLGIARDALASGHESGIHLYHGSRHPDGLYLDAELRAMDREHDNFTYHSCVSGEELRDDDRPGRAEAVALGDHPD